MQTWYAFGAMQADAAEAEPERADALHDARAPGAFVGCAVWGAVWGAGVGRFGAQARACVTCRMASSGAVLSLSHAHTHTTHTHTTHAHTHTHTTHTHGPAAMSRVPSGDDWSHGSVMRRKHNVEEEGAGDSDRDKGQCPGQAHSPSVLWYSAQYEGSRLWY
eukprot:3900486-Rhodomonas_salina.1